MGRQKSAEGILGLSTGPKARICITGKVSGISMKSADADQQAVMPVTTSDGSGRNPREDEDGVSRLTAMTVNSYPQTKQMMEAVVEHKNMMAALRRVEARGGTPGLHTCTYVFQRGTLIILVLSRCLVI